MSLILNSSCNKCMWRLKVGDQVLIKDEARQGKFAPLRKGSYEVIQILSPENTIIRIGNKNRTVHNNRLSLFTPNTTDEPDEDSTSSS